MRLSNFNCCLDACVVDICYWMVNQKQASVKVRDNIVNKVDSQIRIEIRQRARSEVFDSIYLNYYGE